MALANISILAYEDGCMHSGLGPKYLFINLTYSPNIYFSIQRAEKVAVHMQEDPCHLKRARSSPSSNCPKRILRNGWIVTRRWKEGAVRL